MNHSIRALSSSEAYDKGVRGIASTGNVDAPVVQVAARFPFQSYFDSVLLERAILTQKQGEPIVSSTKQTVSVSGYALALHPSSKAPVAVRFAKGGQQGDSTTYVLKPGQILRPVGFTGQDQRFSGFDYGLPFGWLGGGPVTLLVLRSPDAEALFIDRTEIIFQRQRVKILAPADVPDTADLTTFPFNWPVSFPWAHAYSGDFPQQGKQPLLSVSPTRVALSLAAELADPATMRLYFSGTNDFGLDKDSVADLTDVRAVDIIWGTWSYLPSPTMPIQAQYQFLPPEGFVLSANDGALILVDASGTGALAGKYVDIVRYGVL